MRFEVVEVPDGWVVRSEGRDLARYADQDAALADVAERLSRAEAGEPAGLSVRFQRKAS
ncbi:MAG: hypothetical protein JNK30_04350 [Phenylobacterium sp.]|uniref:hypothetical protein n=1 Tax=Phenylobacterium sp. TaxID=1871053 RepID=UPI001A4C535E|nr:hypothetical protein [Phenylobacterium sp.]MBL8770591.1 hypothetical protein [Phenylobacterium sp.]